MTSTEYEKIHEIMTNQDVVLFAKQFCEMHETDPIADYPQTVDSVVMKSSARRQMYLFKAIDLLRRIIFLGGMEAEILRASVYLLVIVHSIDKRLDYHECSRAMKIPELEKKYTIGEVLTSGLEPETMTETLRRTNEFFGVVMAK